MKKILVVISIILSCSTTSEGCHGKPTPSTTDENYDVRSKRSVRPPADARKDLSDFFTECMLRKSKPNIIPQLLAVVEWVLRDAVWYKILDESLCRGRKDTRECWNNEADGLIDWSSELMGPFRECLMEYSTGVRTGGYRQRRQAESWSNFGQTTNSEPDPPCPQVLDQTYGSCMEEIVNDTTEFPSFENFHWESIAIFLREHYTRCRYEQVDEPWTNGRLIYRKTCPPYRFKTTSGSSAQFASQQCVPFILQEVIKDESPLQMPSDVCIERFSNVTVIVEFETVGSTVESVDFTAVESVGLTDVESVGLTAVESVGSTVESLLTTTSEFQRYGHRGRHNGADIIGYCDPKSNFTKWFDNVTDDKSGDSELLEAIREGYPEENICAQPPGIQIRVTKTDEPWYTSGNNLKVMSPGQGLQCVNNMQHHKPCENFKVRFCCLVIPQLHTAPAYLYRKTATTVGTCGSNDRWGYWKNIDSSSRNGGDFEDFKNYGMPSCVPVAVQGRIVRSKRPYTQAHNNLSTEDPKLGIVCKDDMQPRERPCRDFEVRFCCKDGRGVVTPTKRPATTTRSKFIRSQVRVRA